MINKIVQSVADALAGVKDGSVVLIGGAIPGETEVSSSAASGPSASPTC